MVHSPRLVLTALALVPLLSGCIASTAASLVTAPVRVASRGVDMMTTSQSEADEKRGRNMRRREQRLGQLERDYSRHRAQCMRGDSEACEKQRLDYGEIQNLRPNVPVEPGHR